MHIARPSIVDRGSTVALTANLTYHGRTHTVWFSVAPDWAKFLDIDNLDPFVVGALPLALRLGDPIYAAARVSARLLFALNTAVPALVAQTGGDYRPIKVRVAQAVDYAPPPPYSRAVATGFSGGIDSFAVLADHLGPAVLPAHRLTHLLFSNVGSFDPRSADACLQRSPALHECARQLHLPVVTVDSNLAELHGHESFLRDHAFRHIAASLVLQSLIGTHLYAAGTRYEDCFVRGPTALPAAWDPVLLPHLSTERLRVVSVGGQYSRVQKTELVAGFPLSHRYLHVCSSSPDGRNCSTCWPCIRTLLTLELLGHLETYREVFDLPAYVRVRSRAIVEMLRSDDPLWVEVRELARDRGHQFPAALRLAAALPGPVLKAARRALPGGLKRQIASLR
ncbi:MAG: hypothetical protein IPL39_03675 [Opitutaceae bacterium]|nr:hypothetical protein [Opitutaceae bacterium]